MRAKSFFKQNSFFFRPSAWLAGIVAVTLLVFVFIYAFKNTRQEEENMRRFLLERASALIWGIEGGARMSMRGGINSLQALLEETAKQKGISFIAVINAQGEIVAASDATAYKRTFSTQNIAELSAPETLSFRETGSPAAVFEVYKIFAPLPGFREHMGHGRRWRDDRDQHNNTFRPLPRGNASRPFTGQTEAPCFAEATSSLLIVVGLEMRPFMDALVADKRKTLLTAVLIALLGVGGIILVYFIQSYRISKQMLSDTKAFADEVIASLPLALIIADRDGAVRRVNRSAGQLFGKAEEELSAMNLRELPGADFMAIANKADLAVPFVEEEHCLKFSDHAHIKQDLPFDPSQTSKLPAEEDTQDQEMVDEVPVSISASRIVNDEGEDLGILILLRDLREVKKLQDDLRRSERLSTLGNMAARVAHEIRNPLSSIKGFAIFLGGQSKVAAEKEAAEAMIGEVDRLNRVVSELLDFAAPAHLNLRPVDLAELLKKSVSLAAIDAGERGVALKFSNAGTDTFLVFADAERITQVLLNLLLNAVQACAKGGTVTAAIQAVPRGKIRLSITDNGKGMNPETLARIFNPYFTTKASGTGLGLAIARKIIEDHKGDIRVTSSENIGTEAVFTLPEA